MFSSYSFFYSQNFLKSILSNIFLKKIVCGVLLDSRPLASSQNAKWNCGGMLFFSKVAVLQFNCTKNNTLPELFTFFKEANAAKS